VISESHLFHSFILLIGEPEFAASNHALSIDAISESHLHHSTTILNSEPGIALPAAYVRSFFRKNCNFSTKKVSNKP